MFHHLDSSIGTIVPHGYASSQVRPPSSTRIEWEAALSIIPSLPDLNLKFQLVAELLPHPLADAVDELKDVRCGGARMGDDEIGVAIGDFGTAEARAP